MKRRFTALWSRMMEGGSADTAWRQLDVRYREPDRAYHGWHHIAAMLADLDAARQQAEFAEARFDEIELAVFFHDAVYRPGEADNELQSAELLRAVAEPRPPTGIAAIGRVTEMILSTARHLPSDDASTRLLIDLDLAVLAGSSAQYGRYAGAVRAEYAAVPDAAWRLGRATVMRRFLERPRLYQTAFFFELLERLARENIAAEIAALETNS